LVVGGWDMARAVVWRKTFFFFAWQRLRANVKIDESERV